MGHRREPRVEKNLQVRIFGTDFHGKIFSEKVNTVNISKHGVQVSGVKAVLRLDEIVGLCQGQNKGQFQIKWIGETGTPTAGHLGLLNLNPEKPLWDFALPTTQLDTFQRGSLERRRHRRVKCAASTEIHPEGSAVIWGNASDISIGGCYIEMAIPLPRNTKFKAGLWVGEKKLWVSGRVTNSTPGFGFGTQFTDVSPGDLEILKQFVNSFK
ncbi:MAG: PilZ domain-containing protein [Terriglobales bacterium]